MAVDPGWTLETLWLFATSRIDAIEHRFDEVNAEREDRIKERFGSMKTAVDAALAAADRAVTKAEQATERRFESVNEFRGTLADQARELLPRSEYTVQHNGLSEKVAGLDKRLGDLRGVVSGIEERGSGRREGLSSVGAAMLMIATGLSALASVTAVVITLLHR